MLHRLLRRAVHPGPALLALRLILAVAIVFLLQLAQPLLLPVVVALAFTFVLAAPVRRLRRARLPAAAASGIVVASVMCVLGVAGSLLAQPAAQWWDEAPRTVRTLLDSADHLRAVVTGSTPAKARRARLSKQGDPISDKIADEGVTFTRAVLGKMFAFTLEGAATVILLYFFLASEHWLLSRTVEAVPRWRTRALIVGGVRQAQREIGLYLGTMSLVNLGLGLLTALAVQLIGLPNPLMWGASATVLNFVPYLGPALQTGLLLLAGSVAFGAGPAMFAPPAAFLALHAIESNLITPWIVGRRLRLAPLSVFLSVMIWGWLWGIAGAFVAVPILLGLRTVCARSRRLKLARRYLEGDSDGTPSPSLRALLRVRRRPARPRER